MHCHVLYLINLNQKRWYFYAIENPRSNLSLRTFDKLCEKYFMSKGTIFFDDGGESGVTC